MSQKITEEQLRRIIKEELGALDVGTKSEALLRQVVREAFVAESPGWEDQFRPGGEVARGREAFAAALARALKGMKLPHPVVATDLTPRGDVRVWLDTPTGLMKAVLTVDYDTPPEGERVPR